MAASPLKALTANDLGSGRVVFLKSPEARDWTLRFAEAHLFEEADQADAALESARARTRDLADPYLIDVSTEAGLPTPLSLRERIRALGPTTEPDLGVQAEGGAVVEALRLAVGAARSSGRLGLIRRR